MTAILRTALDSHGLDHVLIDQNWFPSIAQESGLLEAAGFEVTSMTLFDRPTPLAPGSTPADWCAHFRARTWEQVPRDLKDRLRFTINDLAAPHLLTDQGWCVDYRRLRFVAIAI